MQQPTLSLVTGTLNRPASLQRLIKSIELHTPMSWELVIADASDVTTANTWGHNVTIIAEKPRLGFVKGYNKAFQATTGKWVLFLNDDAEVQPGYAEAAISFMEDRPRVGLGALYYAEGRLPYRVWSYFGMIYANFGIISRELGNQIGWFDEDLQMYGSDNSLTFKVLLAGNGVVSIPGARVWHHSEPDQWRDQNQVGRISDALTLQSKYWPQIDKLRSAYGETAHLSGPEVIS